MIITKATDIIIALSIVVLFGQRMILYLMALLFLFRWMYIWTTRVALIREVGFWNYSCAFACKILIFTAYLNALSLGVAIAQRKLILDIDKYVFNPYVLSLWNKKLYCFPFTILPFFKNSRIKRILFWKLIYFFQSLGKQLAIKSRKDI